MNLHQVLTGAVNPGDSCFSVGSLHDQPFTAYASGCDIVVLGTDFERLQIIPGAKHGNIQVGCVDCSMQQGKIAASYGKVICIFEPVSILKQNSSHHNVLHYQWQKNAQISLETIVHNLTWDPTGTRLLTGSNCLQLWSNVLLENPADNDSSERAGVGLGEWRCIWQCNTVGWVHCSCGSNVPYGHLLKKFPRVAEWADPPEVTLCEALRILEKLEDNMVQQRPF